MKDIDISEIASRLQSIRQPLDTEEIEKLVNDKFNGRTIKLENLSNEIMSMVADLTGMIRSQDRKFTIDLIQAVCDELRSRG